MRATADLSEVLVGCPAEAFIAAVSADFGVDDFLDRREVDIFVYWCWNNEIVTVLGVWFEIGHCRLPNLY